MNAAKVDLPMPENCGKCNFHDFDAGGVISWHSRTCYALPKRDRGSMDIWEHVLNKTRPDFCPLVEVDKTCEQKLLSIYEWLGEVFESPCGHFVGRGVDGENLERLFERLAPGWCEENCSEPMDYAICWEKYFDLKFNGEGAKVNEKSNKEQTCHRDKAER